MSRSLIIFARAPELGLVKTRLAAVIGPDEALAAYREIGSLVLERTQIARCTRVVAFTPDDRESATRSWLGATLEYLPQGRGDLGERMRHAIRGRLMKDDDRVVVIGSDCPAISVDDIEGAFAALDSADAVFGPATDGGYYLVGVRRDEPALFLDIPWSAPNTLALTLARASKAGLRTTLLGERADIDTIEDLRAWRATG